MRRWPGYTLRTLREEDAHELFVTWALAVDEDLGKAE